MTPKRLAKVLFKPAARYPADPRAVFILALSVFSGITALLVEKGPETLESVMPEWAVTAWSILLVVGSMTTVVGMMIQSVNGIITEQIGSVIVAAATIFYSGVAFYLIGWPALQSVGIILAWGLSCGLRWFQLQSLIRDAVGRAHKREILDKIESEIAQRRTAREIDNRRFRVNPDHDHLGRWGGE